MNLTPKQFLNIFKLVCLICISASALFSQTIDSRLLELRKQYAENYLKPEAHFALAKYYLEKGNKHQAFFIMEYARRYKFPEKVFDDAFIKFFGFDETEPDAQTKAAFEKGYELLKQNKSDEAAQSFTTAANLAPKSAVIQTWVGRFFYKAKTDNATALKYYFNAYFLYPHAYETEYVESRIRNITAADADAQFAKLVKSGKTFPEISTDANPLIVGKAIEQMANQWKSEYKNALFVCLENDDDIIRSMAFETIIKNAGASLDETISTLMNSPDLRKKGLAAYALIEFQREKSFEILKRMLSDKAELIRYDAVSALVSKGGEKGQEIVRQHQKVETNPLLLDLISKNLTAK
jgi:hypothetical protein